jgi:hypothetical protein
MRQQASLPEIHQVLPGRMWKQKSRAFGPAFSYENKVSNLCVSGAAPQTYAISHTRNTAFRTVNKENIAYP